MPLLAVEGVEVRFGGVRALAGASLDAHAGRVTGVIGPNGAGKTTLFDVVTGLRAPSAGRVLVAGRDVTHGRPHHRARLGMSRTFQRLELFESLPVRDNVLVAAEAHHRWAGTAEDPSEVADGVLERLGLREVADQAPDTLPAGTARRVELARALATRPRLLLLDEPASGLDPRERAALARFLVDLAAAGTAVVMVEHDVELVLRVCTDVHVLHLGRVIASGPPARVRADPAVQAAYLGTAGEDGGSG